MATIGGNEERNKGIMATIGGNEEKSKGLMTVIAGNEETSSSTSSPRNRVKFLCSHGGKILPRPADGQLKYVGGETRVVVVPREISFSELMSKLTMLFGDEHIVLKYQLIPEDLDALVSVANDRDLVFMFDEYDRHEKSSENNTGTPRLRAFLFPSSPILIENQTPTNNDSQALEQRYIDAINGVVRTASSRPNFNIPSPSLTSPIFRTPDMYNIDTHESFSSSGFRNRQSGLMHRVHSSPSNLCNLGQQHNQHHHQQPLEQHQQPFPVPRSHSRGVVPSFSIGHDVGRSQLGHSSKPARYYHYHPSTRVQHRDSNMDYMDYMGAGYDSDWRG